MENVAATFEQAFISLLSEDNRYLEQVAVVTPGEIEQIREWNKNIPNRAQTRMQDPVYQQRLLRPDALAVQGWDGDMTYKQLDMAANRLASYLISLGVRPETKIPLCFEKSRWAVISQLAIFKAGGCVVPLGPKQPMRRVEMILQDIEACIVLTAGKFVDKFKNALPHIVTIDEAFMSELPESEAPPCSATSDHAAFIIYTSGSTGVPKGVVLTHGSLCTSVHNLGSKFKLSPETRMIQFSAYTFDISIQDIYATWNYGGCVCIIPEEDRINNLGPAMRSYKINAAGLTSTVAGLISPKEVPSLQTLILLGEAVKPAVVDQWTGHVTLFNAYGPSECSIQASCTEIGPGCDPLNIGYAFAGALWVVEPKDYNRLAPIGAPGELLIEGPLQARGYLNDEAKTAAAFITDPAWVSKYGFGSGRRFYRTGDLVQQNQDGSITYIGRRDTQIKVRGQRVETGEIEYNLMQHDAVLDAAVLYPLQGPCENRLVGLLSLRQFVSDHALGLDINPVPQESLHQAKLEIATISQYLTAYVPEHMLPSVWIPLACMMPQNDSAKLDRKKLTQWMESLEQNVLDTFTSTNDNQEEMRAPATPAERDIQNAWADVLKLPLSQVPVEQNSFLGLGGDSLAAMQVASRLRTQGIFVMVRTVLESKSIAQLALDTDKNRASNENQEVSHNQQLYFESGDMPPINVDYWGLDIENNLHGDQISRQIVLDEGHTELLFGEANNSRRTQPVEIMLAALADSFHQTFPDRLVPTIFDEIHSRDPRLGTNALDTKEWRTAVMPMYVPVDPKDSALKVLQRTKESRRSIKLDELRFFDSKLWAPQRRRELPSNQPMEILFKHPGRFAQEERDGYPSIEAETPSEFATSPLPDDTRRFSILSIDVTVSENKLHVDFQFNRYMKRQDEVCHWIEVYKKSLCDLVSKLVVTSPILALSDFPLVPMSSEGLVKLQDTILPKAGIKLAQIEDIYPCSPTQQGILMSQLKSPSEYYIQQSIEIRATSSSSRVSIDRFMDSWQILVNRHPVLRTVFVESAAKSGEGLFDQIVLKSCKANMEYKACAEAEVESYLAVQTGLNKNIFENHLGHKFTVYSTPSQRVYAQIIISHALVDASSLVLLQQELVDVYDGKIRTDSTGPAFREYISHLQKTPEDEALRYWSSRLADTEPCYLPAFTTASTSAVEESSENVALQHVTADLEGLADLQKFSKAHGVTVANIFQIAWALVLSQYTGSADVSFGYLSSGRDVPVAGVDQMLGPLLNMMVTQIKLDPALSVGDAVRQIQEDFFKGFNYQRAPLLKIWHALELKGQSLFNTSISYQHALTQKEDESDIVLEPITGEDRTEYDITVNVFVSDKNTSVSLQYSPNFVSSEGANRLVRCLQQVLKSLAANPDLPIGQVQMVPQEDVEQICLWNKETPETKNDHCVHDIVAHNRLLAPEAPAVCAWDGNLTYQELDDLTDQLAHHLVADLGVGPETMIPLCFDKSLWSIVAQLGVLKSGGAVVSVNPKHPTQRLEGILQDVDARIMLTAPQYASRFYGIVSHVLGIDSSSFSNFPKKTGPACRIVNPENSAFIIYTSGSTGRPKGVVLTHLSLTASFQGHGKVYGMNPSTRSVQFASYTFDASISDIWGTIYHGGCVCVISEAERMNNLQAAIESYQVNLAQLTPTVAELLDVSKLSTLKTLVLGGEPVKSGMVEKLLVAADRLDVLNGYGPSECTIYTTCSAPLKDKNQAPNIGRPLVGGVWLVSNESVCPIGSVGEIWIEGSLLADGYLNDEQKTNKSFITDPSWARSVGLQGRRFYRTGDLARQTPTGDLIHLGRRDTQVKIRGQRVEIGEIEYTVQKFLPAAKTVVATMVTPNSTNRSPMVAVVMEVDSSLESNLSGNPTQGILLPSNPSLREAFSQLRSSLTDALPLYMVPRLFVPAVELPQTTSGKLDRRFLQQLLENLSEEELFQYSLSTVNNTRPNTYTERKLQSLWAAVLGMNVDQIGVHEHFLHFGGDSVTAMRLVSMANASDISLTVSDVFKYPKLLDMAAHVDNHIALEHQSAQIPRFALWKEISLSENPDRAVTERIAQVAGQCGVLHDNIEDIYPCTPLQEGLMAVTAQKPHAYIGRWVFRMREAINSKKFKLAWEKLAGLVPILRTRIVPGELSGALQVVMREAVSCLDAQNLEEYLKKDTQESFPYGSPLIRAAVIEATENERYFVLTAHHSAYDGWSLVRLFAAVSHIYTQQNIPPVPSYTRFIRYLDQQDPVATKAFWESQFEGSIGLPFPTLPQASYQPRPSQMKTCRLQTWQVEGSTTLASLLRAAWAMVVSSYSGSNVLLAVALSGRAAPVSGVQDMLAPTITTVPVRIHVDSTQSIKDYVAAVHKQAVDMIPFEHTGLQNIRRLVSNAVYPQHLFAVQPAEERKNLIDGELLTLEPGTNSAQVLDGYALTIECFTGMDGDAIDIEARFDDGVLSSAQTTRLLDRFRHIFNQLLKTHASNCEEVKSVGDIETVSPEDITQLAQWNSDIPEVQQVLVHDLVHQQALFQPDADAICSWDGDLSRDELDQHAEKLAHHLVHLGVGPEVMVGLCFDKSKWAVVSMLAILKAGGAVVPVRAQPVQRLQAIVNNTKLNFVLTSPRPESRFSCQVSHVLSVDDVLLSELPQHSQRLQQTVCPQNTAFVFHTSGSTGVPKGVVIEHGAMSTSLQSHGAKFGMTQETRAFQFSHLTFDISLHDIITTLQFGGCVCLPSEQERMNNLVGAINRMGVNYTFLPPRVLHTVRPSDIPNVRTVVVGGEAVQAEQIEPWLHEARVFNAYGPSECSIAATCNEVVDKNHASTIGRAIAGGLWVVNEADYNRLLPIGAVGELLIEGPLLARGYLNDPEKTSAAFITNPYWLTQYELNASDKQNLSTERRMYRTGDLVQQADDGSLKYVGRRDNQIQIRGQRVEIGEVEHYLLKQPAIVDGVVLYPQRGPSKSRLVGIVTLRDFISEATSESGAMSAVQPTATEQLPHVLEYISSVRQNLLECVSEYMVPDVWISLASMPQNNSDKIDRPKLTRWVETMDAEYLDSITRSSEEDRSQMPTSNLEERLRTVFAEVLQLPLEKVARDRSFLSMGGDSITAMQVVSRCTSRYGISLVVRDVLQSKSATQLALKARAESAEMSDDDVTDLPFNLSPSQHMYFESIAPRGLEVGDENRFNQSVCLVIKRPINIRQIEHAAGTLVAKHAMLRARFLETEHGWKQKIEAEVAGSFHFAAHEVSHLKQAQKVASFAERHLNLVKGPVFSASCIQVESENKRLLFLTAHHLVVDIVSWQIIVRDLEDLIHRSASATSSKGVSFQSWTRLQTKHSQERMTPMKSVPFETPIADWSYWGLTPSGNVYGDRVGEELVLEEELTSLLFTENQPLGTEPIEVMIAALFHSFHKVFPDRPVPTVFNEGHGREPWADSINLSDTVGWFTTLAPIHVPVHDDDLINVLRRTKDTRRSVPERGLAYFLSRFLTTTGKDAFASHSQAEVMFNYTGRYKQPRSAESLFTIEHDFEASSIGMNVKRMAIFEIEASVRDNRFCIGFHFSRKMRNQDAVRLWVQTFQSSLQEMLAHLSTATPTYTLSDFPAASMTYDELLLLQTELLPQVNISGLPEVEDIYPCSPIQQGILMSQIKDPFTYHVQQSCEIIPLKENDTVDFARLSAAWEEVVARHAILRTIFLQSISSRELFYQVVRKQWKPQTRKVYCERPDDVVPTFSRGGRPKYVDGQPQYQFTICETATGKIFAQIDVSHALMDASSLGIILQDLVQAYDCVLPGLPAPSYGTYVSFLRQTSPEESLAYWTDRLKNAEPCYLPPTSSQISDTRELKHVVAHIDDLTLLHNFRDTHGVTIANILQLAWAVVLARYTQSTDVTFGYLANGRDAPISGINEMAGPMINMTVTRVQLTEKSISIADAAKLVQDNFLEAFNHQRTSLGEIQHALHLSEHSLFNTTVSYKREAIENLTGPASLAVKGTSGEDPTEYDLNVDIVGGESQMRISLQYASSFLDNEAAERILGSLQSALAFVLSNDQASLCEVEALCSSDIQLLRQWNSNLPDTVEYPVHDSIYQRCLSQPTAPAVCAWDGQLTYEDMDRLSGRLSQHLARLGVGKEIMVGLCFEKSMWTVIAMLAVLKAGGVAVPLGTQLPLERLRFILEDTRAPVVLTTDEHAKKLNGIATAHVLKIDEASISALPEESSVSQRPKLDAKSAAVVIYTSGSTGQPKGVILTHGSLSTSIERHGTILKLGPSTRTLQFSAYVFDISLLDIFSTLRFGGCICIVSEEDRMDIKSLENSMETMGVNFAVLTPTVAGLIVPKAVPTLRTLVLAGEKVQPVNIETWSPHVAVFNGYGPAECTILSTINGPMTDKNRAANIGGRVSGMLWVVDQSDHNSLVPIGAVGELLIEGPLLARGYLHDQKKTADAFVADPSFISKHKLGSSTGRRMYRTGDLVRQDPIDGSITYIGRADGQVKIRGQRVEVGEIEFWVKESLAETRMAAAALLGPRGNRNQAILAVAIEFQERVTSGCPVTPGSPFITVTDPLRRSLIELQNALSNTLPSYMVPALYVPMAHIPLTASGKLDRKSLSSTLECLDEDQLTQYALVEATDINLSTKTEYKLRDLWVSVLSTSGNINGNSHFFRSGGDSVTAMRLVALARNNNPPMSLNVADIFKNPVLSNMAHVVDAKLAKTTAGATTDAAPFSLCKDLINSGRDHLSLVSLKCNVAAEAIQDIYPCTPLQEGLMAITAQQPLAYINRWVFKLDESIDINRFKNAWEQVFEMSPILRTRILQGSTSGAIQVVIQEKMNWVEISSDLESYQAQDTARPMGFGTPLMRFAIVTNHSHAERLFVWTAHHSVYDGWASSKLLEAVSKIYLSQATPSFVPYTRFIEHLQNVSSSDTEDYWLSQLNGGGMSFTFPSLPKHHQPGPAKRLTYRINARATADGITIATLLRSTWALVLSQETDNQNVVFPTTLSGRSAPVADILDIIAPTITTVPIRISLDRAQKLSEFLQTVQQQATDMIPFEHTGLQNIRSIIQHPLDFNHLFVIQPSADGPDRNFPGLQLLPVEADELTGYPLAVICNTIHENHNNIIELNVRFDQDVLPSGKMQSLLERFEHVLHQLQSVTTDNSQARDQLVGDVEFMTPHDVERIRGWNQCTRVAERANTCVHDLVYDQQQSHPDAPAVCAWDGDLSYRQLDRLASRLAHHLSKNLGVGPEKAVAMIFEKTKWAVVSQLAVLKAGGVIVPINHQHPTQRIQGVVDAVGTQIILTSQNPQHIHGLVPNILVVNEQLLAQLPSQDVSARRTVCATDPAYIIFTSGSTGVPKGVVLEHGSIVTSMQAQGAQLAGSRTRTLQFSAFNFDVSIGEVFTTLIFGGCVCMVSEEDRMNNLAGAMKAAAVNLAYLTPTVASLMKPQEVPALEKLVFLGEALRPEVTVPWIDSQVQLYNGFGPAESSILTTINHITDTSQAPNIGTALAGGKLWVADASNYHQLVPIGTVGELLIEGPLLARGYLADEKKTAQSFVTDPNWCRRSEFGSSFGRRFYRTGDLVRQNLDGSLVYIGRRDTQVKINGQRVEIGEIEYWVKEKLPIVQEVIVGLVESKELDNEAGSQDKVLAVAMEIQDPEIANMPHQEIASLKLLQVSDTLRQAFAQLRTSLLEVLPPYMVPQLFLPLISLPLTDSGKLDRRVTWTAVQKLPSLSEYFLVDGVKVPPCTPTELQLQELWAAALNIPSSSVGARDDFFRSGGDSISAMRLVSKAREHGKLSLSVSDIFRSPTLSDLAAIAERKSDKHIQALETYEPFSSMHVNGPADSLKHALNPLLSAPGVIIDAAPTTDFQTHSVISSLRKSRDLLAYMSIDGDGIPDISRWKASCLELIKRHEVLRTAYVFHEERLLQVVLEEYHPKIVHYETEKTTIDQFSKQLIAQDMHRQPQLGRPFVEFAIVTSVSDLQHRIVFRLSHAEYDGISMSYFMDTLQAIYDGQPVGDYVPFSRYIYSLSSRNKEESRQYWRSLLKDSSMPTIATESDMPRQRPSKLVHHATRQVKVIQPLPSGITTSTIIRSAWALVLARHVNSRDVIFGEVVSGRNTGDPVAEKAAGCCANAIPTRATFDDSWTVSELLRHLQKQQLDRLPHETLGFREILTSCANMPPSTHFTSQVNHRHETPGWKLNIGEVDYNISIALPEGAEDLADIDITSFMQSNHVEIALGYLDGVISPRLAETLMNMLCTTVDFLLNRSHDTLIGSVLPDNSEGGSEG